ncbi:MAG: glycosyltransferase [Pseudomonadota bacterium]|nr:glycosyltransferase [Pseudomonadota bacterium]
MKFVLFYHSLISDWNHGNAHFLRGIASELLARGHTLAVYEPADAWSVQHLVQTQGPAALRAYQAVYPGLSSQRYRLETLDLDAVLDGADVVLAHEWNEPALIAALGRHRRGQHYRLLFHDTHHRAVSEPEQMARFDLRDYDGVLAFGERIRALYLERGWTRAAWTWHEAADTRLFHPLPEMTPEADLVWIGNWGDDERGEELREFLIEPVAQLGLTARVHGVRYPDAARAALAAAGIDYRDWLANYQAPAVFARHRMTVHVPRRWYARALPGIPTIRMFEALACGIPLVSAPWEDSEGLFRAGSDYLLAASGAEMTRQLARLRDDPALRSELAGSGRERILARHTCAHRVDELLAILARLQPPVPGAVKESIA